MLIQGRNKSNQIKSNQIKSNQIKKSRINKSMSDIDKYIIDVNKNYYLILLFDFVY
jgi:hypothetical protein